MDTNKADAKLSRTRSELCDRSNPDLVPYEVALALQIMTRDGDNVAYFGVNGCYLYSEFIPELRILQ